MTCTRTITSQSPFLFVFVFINDKYRFYLPWIFLIFVTSFVYCSITRR